MSTPSDGTSPDRPAAVDSEATGLWPIDDPEKTANIVRPPAGTQRPAGTAPWLSAPAPTPPTSPPPANTTAPYQPQNPETTAAVARPAHAEPTAQPWTPPGTPAGQPPIYGQPPQHPYPPAPGQPPSSYPTTTGYAPPPEYAPQPKASDTDWPEHTTTTTRGQRRRNVLLIGVAAAVVVIAAVGVTGFWKPGFFLTRQLNIAKVQDGVQHILTDPNTGYGISGISGLSCNDGKNPAANSGDKFTCQMTINGATHHVEVTVVDDHGTYQVGQVT